jgi:hypothetical protein
VVRARPGGGRLRVHVGAPIAGFDHEVRFRARHGWSCVIMGRCRYGSGIRIGIRTFGPSFDGRGSIDGFNARTVVTSTNAHHTATFDLVSHCIRKVLDRPRPTDAVPVHMQQ